MHMGITAENVAERYKISREMQDASPLASQQRRRRHRGGLLQRADRSGEIATRKGTVLFQEDEHVRASTTWKCWRA